MTAVRRIVLAGGTGLIGRTILATLKARGDHPVVITRRPDEIGTDPAFAGVELVAGNPTRSGDWQRQLDGAEAVINLAGHPIFPSSLGGLFADRWSDSTKRAILGSRVESARRIVEAIRAAARPPEVLVQGSAIGYYGSRGDEACEEGAPPGDDFLAKVCVDWEAAAGEAKDAARVAIVRTGIVLARESGALKLLIPLFRFVPGAAAPIGNPRSAWLPASGAQWLSWIHRDDIAGLFLRALDRDDLSGPMNGVAPHPVTQLEFTKSLAAALGRFSLPFGPPTALLRLLVGEAAGVLASGQRVLPAVASRAGFSFQFPELGRALADLLGKAPEPGFAGDRAE
jgi:uncharacterized protein (TIGR01777 family)